MQLQPINNTWAPVAVYLSAEPGVEARAVTGGEHGFIGTVAQTRAAARASAVAGVELRSPMR